MGRGDADFCAVRSRLPGKRCGHDGGSAYSASTAAATSSAAASGIAGAACSSTSSRAPGISRAALRAYDAARRPATTELVLRNRGGGPEGVIDEVERRAPNGFTRLADVIDPAEVHAALVGYQAASGAMVSQGSDGAA